ncbi:hypothetical protein ACO0LB_20325, partial [Undibacterium sp. SXout7W]|uniref:hypothetical protein n=1 Tax=Undibacterium sp. SXout7W TaxID=3413049 RepID=UPI003BF0E869
SKAWTSLLATVIPVDRVLTGVSKISTEVKTLTVVGEDAAVATAARKVEQGVTKDLPPLRQAYVDEVRALEEVSLNARAAGATAEDTARMVSQMRRDLGIKYKNLTPPDELEKIYARNLEKYGDQLGPTIDYMRKVQGKTWEQIIEKSFTPGGKDLGY